MRYTPEQLEGLRQSPLVKKPDGLPSILQWMDVPADQSTNNNHAVNNNGTARRTRGTRDGEAAATEHRTDRPLINPMGQFGRRQSMQPGEETVLGPPKLNFTSAARAAKNTGDKQERTGIVSTDGDQLGDRFPRDKTERWTRDGDRDRNRERGITNGRRGAREDGEGWTSVKGRKSLGQEDFERFNRNGDRGDRSDRNDRNRDKTDGALEDDAPPRRGQRDRADRAERWGRRDDTKEEGSKFGVQGGWRERTQQSQREPRERGEREWDRGAHRGEEDPEWMDTKAEKKKEPQMKTQADFERWKEQMKAKDTPAEERSAPKESPTAVATATGIAAAPMFTAPVQTPAAESTQGILFGNWGNVKGADVGQDETIKAKPKPAKASKFMSMFAKPEEPTAPSPVHAPAPASPAPYVPHANEDQQGFQRILQMLGQVNVASPQAPPPNEPSPPNGVRGHGGGISLDFQQSPPPELLNHRPPPNRTLEQQSILQNILAPRAAAPESRPLQQPRFSTMSPENAHQEQFGPPRPESGRQEGQSPFQQPPSRNANPQDANLAAILNSRAREDSQRDQGQKQRERDFLLTLMQQPRNTPPQMMSQNLPRGGPPPMAMFENMQHEQRAPPQPKGRGGLPPGYMEDPRMFNENELMRQEAQRREQELRQQLNIQQQQQQQQQDLRNKNQRVPMGFPGHEDPTLGLQRRNTAGEIPRQMTNMGIPSQQHPDMPFMGGRGQPGMPPTPQDRPNIAPPPGFGGPMRQPPGFGGPNPQPQMGPGVPSFSAGNTPLGGHPPGLPQLGGGSMRGMPPGFPGGPGGNGMQGPPQGYFPPPPGYGLPPGMRGEDPRMMFEGQFGGPGPRPQQQGRPGPPNMY